MSNCDCSDCASCYPGECPVEKEMSRLAREAALKYPNAISFAWENGRMVPIAWKEQKCIEESSKKQEK